MLRRKVIHWFIHLLWLGACAPRALQPQTEADLQAPYTIDASQTGDSKVEALILPYREPLKKAMAETLAWSDAPATKGLPESSIGNLITDLLRSYVHDSLGQHADICVLNHGGLRVEWPKGPIRRSSVFELMPFENELVMLAMTPAQIDTLMATVALKGGAALSGLALELEAKNVKSWNAHHPKELYWVLSSDYLMQGGDGFRFPHRESRRLHLKVRDAIEQALIAQQKEGKTLKPALDGRIRKY